MEVSAGFAGAEVKAKEDPKRERDEWKARPDPFAQLNRDMRAQLAGAPLVGGLVTMAGSGTAANYMTASSVSR